MWWLLIQKQYSTWDVSKHRQGYTYHLNINNCSLAVNASKWLIKIQLSSCLPQIWARRGFWKSMRKRLKSLAGYSRPRSPWSQFIFSSHFPWLIYTHSTLYPTWSIPLFLIYFPCKIPLIKQWDSFPMACLLTISCLLCKGQRKFLLFYEAMTESSNTVMSGVLQWLSVFCLRTS